MEPLTTELHRTLLYDIPTRTSEITMDGPDVHTSIWYYLRDEIDIKVIEPLDGSNERRHYSRAFNLEELTFPGWYLYEVSEENWKQYGRFYPRDEVVAHVKKMMDSIPQLDV